MGEGRDMKSLPLVTPVTTEWKTMPWTKSPDALYVPTNLYYIDEKIGDAR
jgi:hypothetical protein